MPLLTYLQLLSIGSMEVVFDNARSPVAPVSRPTLTRRRKNGLKSKRPRPASKSSDSNNNRWEQTETKQDQRPLSPTRQEQPVDTALKLPVRCCSCEFTSEMLQAVFVTALVDAAPIMPRRYAAAPVLSLFGKV
ncbi:hypothetical protein MPSEU_000511500 [Mayamaea pseudoterrestris]|nr:hypothetical protein MPSEU_000511500 [Mayamaea pseudoterrestris]